MSPGRKPACVRWGAAAPGAGTAARSAPSRHQVRAQFRAPRCQAGCGLPSGLPTKPVGAGAGPRARHSGASSFLPGRLVNTPLGPGKPRAVQGGRWAALPTTRNPTVALCAGPGGERGRPDRRRCPVARARAGWLHEPAPAGARAASRRDDQPTLRVTPGPRGHSGRIRPSELGPSEQWSFSRGPTGERAGVGYVPVATLPSRRRNCPTTGG